MMKASRLDYISESATLDIIREECKYRLDSTTHVKNPIAYLLIGQPGSGKTRLATMAQELSSNDTVFINNDENRMLHPFYEELYACYKDKANELVSPFASKVTEGMIDILSDKKRNLIIEGTGQHPEVQLGTARKLKEKGYEINICVIAEKPAISKLQIVLRGTIMQEKGIPPRFTSFCSHDTAFSFLPETVDILYKSSFVDSVEIWNSKLEKMLTNSDPKTQPSETLYKFWGTPFSDEEYKYMQNKLQYILGSKVDIPSEYREYVQQLRSMVEKHSNVALEGKLKIAKEQVLTQHKNNSKEKEISLGV